MSRTTLTDETWSRLFPILKQLGIYRKKNLRKTVEGILFRLRKPKICTRFENLAVERSIIVFLTCNHSLTRSCLFPLYGTFRRRKDLPCHAVRQAARKGVSRFGYERVLE